MAHPPDNKANRIRDLGPHARSRDRHRWVSLMMLLVMVLCGCVYREFNVSRALQGEWVGEDTAQKIRIDRVLPAGGLELAWTGIALPAVDSAGWFIEEGHLTLVIGLADSDIEGGHGPRLFFFALDTLNETLTGSWGPGNQEITITSFKRIRKE